MWHDVALLLPWKPARHKPMGSPVYTRSALDSGLSIGPNLAGVLPTRLEILLPMFAACVRGDVASGAGPDPDPDVGLKMPGTRFLAEYMVCIR